VRDKIADRPFCFLLGGLSFIIVVTRTILHRWGSRLSFFFILLFHIHFYPMERDGKATTVVDTARRAEIKNYSSARQVNQPTMVDLSLVYPSPS